METGSTRHRTRAEEVVVDPVGDVASVDAQAAIAELDDEKETKVTVADLESRYLLLLQSYVLNFGIVPVGLENDVARALQK